MRPDGSGHDVLVVGYGNELRGDDCAGRRVAEIIVDRGCSDIEVRSVHQLTPDLAPLIAKVDLVIFVDAAEEALEEEIRVRRLMPVTPTLDGAHAGSASELLGLASWLYGRCPEAYAVDIAAVNFDYSLSPSPRTQKAINIAVACVEGLVSDRLETLSCTK